MKAVPLVFGLCIILASFNYILPQATQDASLADFAKSFAKELARRLTEMKHLPLPSCEKTFSNFITSGRFSLSNGWVSTELSLNLLGVDSDVLKYRTGKTINIQFSSPEVIMGYQYSASINCIGSISGKFKAIMKDVISKVVFSAVKIAKSSQTICQMTNANMNVEVNPGNYRVEFFIDLGALISKPASYVAEKIINTFIKYRFLETARDVLQKKTLETEMHGIEGESKNFQQVGLEAFCENL